MALPNGESRRRPRQTTSGPSLVPRRPRCSYTPLATAFRGGLQKRRGRGDISEWCLKKKMRLATGSSGARLFWDGNNTGCVAGSRAGCKGIVWGPWSRVLWIIHGEKFFPASFSVWQSSRLPPHTQASNNSGCVLWERRALSMNHQTSTLDSIHV